MPGIEADTRGHVARLTDTERTEIRRMVDTSRAELEVEFGAAIFVHTVARDGVKDVGGRQVRDGNVATFSGKLVTDSWYHKDDPWSWQIVDHTATSDESGVPKYGFSHADRRFTGHLDALADLITAMEHKIIGALERGATGTCEALNKLVGHGAAPGTPGEVQQCPAVAVRHVTVRHDPAELGAGQGRLSIYRLCDPHADDLAQTLALDHSLTTIVSDMRDPDAYGPGHEGGAPVADPQRRVAYADGTAKAAIASLAAAKRELLSAVNSLGDLKDLGWTVSGVEFVADVARQSLIRLELIATDVQEDIAKGGEPGPS